MNFCCLACCRPCWTRRDFLPEFQGRRLWPVYEQMGSNDAYVYHPDRDHKEDTEMLERVHFLLLEARFDPLGAAKEKQHRAEYTSPSTSVPFETNMIQKLIYCN